MHDGDVAAAGAGPQTAPAVQLDPEHCYTSSGSVQFSSTESAAAATSMLECSPEVNKDSVSALFETDGANLKIQVAAAKREELQAAVKSIYNLTSLMPKEPFGG